MTQLAYPPARQSDQVDDYHGVLVADPYRWLEEVDAPETLAWVSAENDLTAAFLDRVPARDRLRRRLAELWNFPRRLAPVPRGGRYFQLRNTGLQNQDVLYVLGSTSEAGSVLLDPNTLSADGTAALVSWSVSQDGEWLAYAVSASGSDWQTWRVRSVATGADLPEILLWSKFSGAAWLPDHSGFLYAQYPAPTAGQAYAETNFNQKIYLHRLNTSQSEDRLVYARPDQKEWGFEPIISDDGQYIILHTWQGTDVRNRIFYCELPLSVETSFQALVPDLVANYTFIGSAGPRLFFLTNDAAPRGQVIAIDVRQPAPEFRQTILPESADNLEAVRLIHGEFIALYLHDAHHRLARFGLDGEPLGELSLPAMGSIVSINYDLNLTGNPAGAELFYAFHSFIDPPSIYRYDFSTAESRQLHAPALDFPAEKYTTRQVFVASKDGTRLPLFLVHRKDLKYDGQNPTLLYGYGGFNLAITPAFQAGRLAWLELGGVLAIAGLRGGSEYGEAWHQAGMFANKQNVFDDFIACAEYLIAEKITSTPKLAIEGRSNGGLLVGACLAQRPDLFGAALAHVGVMDMLRFHLFTIGWAWTSDYGSAADPDQFKVLYAYSPLHNLRPGCAYPATLVTTGDHDDRVVPGHSFKFAAALQAAQVSEAPVLIRIQTKAGHGFGKPTTVLIEEQADIWAFLVKVLNIE